MGIQFNCQKHFYFKLFRLFKQLYITIQFSASTDFVYTHLNVKTVLCQTIQLSVNTVSMSKTVLFQIIQFNQTVQFSIDMTLSGATTTGQSGPGSNSNERVLRLPQSPATLGKKTNDDIYTANLSWLVGFYGISTFVGYLTPNPFLCK